MEIIIICLAAFFTAILTFFSGFGLGTILTPVFAVFFPVDIAIALTGVVHFANNLFKITLVGKSTDRAVLLRFGIPAILASFAGAWLLLRITDMPSLFNYHMWGKEYEVMPVNIVIASLVDFTRLSVYASRFREANLHEHWILILSAISAAILGAFIGNKLLRKVTLRFVQVLVAIMLFLIAIVLGAGII